jgi:hypothetical protein
MVEKAAAPAGMASNKVECNACPVLCQISEGRAGACDRYANRGGRLIRVDPVLFLSKGDAAIVQRPFPALAAPAAGIDARAAALAQGEGEAVSVSATPAAGGAELFVTGVGASTTYPDYKPAPFIVSSRHADVDMVTVVTEGIFSYCSFKVKIDTDRWLGPEQADVRYDSQVVGHVTTAEYGSQMLSLGGVHHLTGTTKQEGRATCDVMLALGNRRPVELQIAGGASLVIQAGRAPVVDGTEERRMRVGCGSATIGIFARQWAGEVDEVVVVDDHITGVLTEHQAGRCLSMPRSGIRIHGRKSTPGRYFQVARPGVGWGGTDISDPLSIVAGFTPRVTWPGLRLLMVSTTGEHWAYFTLDDKLVPRPAELPASLRQSIERIGENCEPSVTSVLFVAGAGGSLRAGATDNPIRLTQAIKAGQVNVTCGGAPAYIWPGGGITLMVDVARMPGESFGMVPTPALVAPIEFTLSLHEYRALGGHLDRVRDMDTVLAQGAWHTDGAPQAIRLEGHPDRINPWPIGRPPMLG